MKSAIRFVTVLFFLFLLVIIYHANTGTRFIVFDWVQWVPLKDKVGHFVLLGCLTILANMGFEFREFSFKKRNLFVGTIAVIGFALIEEFSQIFIKLRSFELADLLADGLGISLFHYFSKHLMKKWKQRELLK